MKKYHLDKVNALFYAWTKTWLSEGFRNWNLKSELEKIEIPILFIQSKDDEFGSLSQLEITKSMVKGDFDAFILDDLGHSPHKRVPDCIINRVAAFVENLVN